LNSIVDTDPSAFSVITTENNENNWNSQYLSILYTLWIRLLLEVYLLYLIINSMSYN
jgi:hypothetical protein